MQISRERKAELFLVFTTMIWGGTFAVIKSGLQEASPLMLMGARFTLAFLCFSLIFPGAWKHLNRSALAGGAVLGVLMFLGYGLQVLGLKETTASRSGFITYTFALYTPLLQFLILKKKPAGRNLLGLLIVITGLYFLSRPGKGALNRGDILTFAGAVATAFYVIFLDRIARKHNTLLLTVLQFLVCAVLSFSLAPAVEAPYIRWNLNFLLSLFYLGVMGSVVAIALMTRFQKDITPTRAVIVYALEPLFAMTFAVIFLRERLSLPEWIGCLFILSGVIFSEFKAQEKGSKEKVSQIP